MINNKMNTEHTNTHMHSFSCSGNAADVVVFLNALWQKVKPYYV